jgi:4-alpha-glucanotransferase
MSDLRLYHNSHDILYRKPFGALPCHEKAHLALHLAGGEGKTSLRVVLRLWKEKEGVEQLCEMTEVRSDGGDRVFAVDCEAPGEPGLLWYYFYVEWLGGRVYYGNQNDGLGGEGRASAWEPPSYQITVYKAAPVPLWWKNAVIYQIFVDRFYRGDGWQPAQAQVLCLPEDRQGPRRVLHLDWNDTPFYTKDSRGRITRWPFFGGNLDGVRQKLGSLKALGVSVLYLNPIFTGASNHKYDTGDYCQIDPGFGGELAFRQLLSAAEEQGIAVILDGVFSHTGRDSLYFNGYGNFGEEGAAQSDTSPYYKWYQWKDDGTYESWWGVDDLPNVNETDDSYQDFIWRDQSSVIRSWMRAGVRGWRLDVADELPDSFIRGLRQAVKETSAEGVLIGEVWEDATNKVSYGERREYFSGEELDATMNYPFRENFLSFVQGKQSAETLCRKVMSLYENYPRENFYAAMNLIGSHDRARILTLLGDAPAPDSMSEAEREAYRLSPEQKQLAALRLKLLVAVQMTFPGVPSVYYGDEAGLEGFNDPYNRGTYPWGKEDEEILEWHRSMIKLREEYPVFQDGDFQPFFQQGVFGFARQNAEESLYVLVNPSLTESYKVRLWDEACADGYYPNLITGTLVPITVEDGQAALRLTVEPLTAVILYRGASGATVPLVEAWPRSAGVLCHITSLPSLWGIGDLGEGALAFVDFLAAAGQKVWQVLPVNPPGAGHSPFSPLSAFAGNELLLDLDDLAAQGLLGTHYLMARARKTVNIKGERAQFKETLSLKKYYFKEAFSSFDRKQEDFVRFCAEESFWLEDYCLYCAIHEHLHLGAWQNWPQPLRDRESETLNEYRLKLRDDCDYYAFLQYEFARQWEKLVLYARENGVEIWGDMPIYVSTDGADTWAHRGVFRLDAEGRSTEEAGVPPDYFSAGGQTWGLPVYDWQKLENTGYTWWIERLKLSAARFARTRLDHFRGFEAYWSLPEGATDMQSGSWHKGPGRRFFQAVREALGELPFLAEDLGYLTSEVHTLKNLFNLPGIKVFQFSAWEMLQKDLTQADAYNVFYTGTHDNGTLLSWYRSEATTKGEKPEDEGKDCNRIIAKLYASEAWWVILPLQDVLGLDDEHRMNVPGQPEGNWGWRVGAEELTQAVARSLRELVERHTRI